MGDIVRKKAYVIEYGIQVNWYSTEEPEIETRIEFYTNRDRDTFFARYFELKRQDQVREIKTYFAELNEINLEEIYVKNIDGAI